MAQSSFDRLYAREDLTLLVGSVPIDLLRAMLLGVTLTEPISAVQLTTTQGVLVKWTTIPSGADIAAVDAFMAGFVGGTTTSEPFEQESLGVTQATSGTLVDKLDFTTPPLSPGTYQMCWCSTLRMNPAGANSGVLGTVRITRSDAVFREQTDAWDLTAHHAYNGAITFKVLAGQTLNAKVSVSRIGANGTAEMLGVRLTIDQLSAA